MITHKLKPFLLWTLEQLDIPLDVIRWEIFPYFDNHPYWKFLKNCFDNEHNELLEWLIDNTTPEKIEPIYSRRTCVFGKYNELIKKVLHKHYKNPIPLRDTVEFLERLCDIDNCEIMKWFHNMYYEQEWIHDVDNPFLDTDMLEQIASNTTSNIAMWFVDNFSECVIVKGVLYKEVIYY